MGYLFHGFKLTAIRKKWLARLLLYTIAIYMEDLMTISISTVFTNNRTQAVRLPADARLPEQVKKVFVRVLGNERIISPIDNVWNNFFLIGPAVSEDFMTECGTRDQSRFNVGYD
jgi:antitoxin VapB